MQRCEAEEDWSPIAQLVQGCLRAKGRPGRNLGAPPQPARFQSVLPVHRQFGPKAEDLSQEVFLRIYRTLASYRTCFRRVSHVAHQRCDAQPAGGSIIAARAATG